MPSRPHGRELEPVRIGFLIARQPSHFLLDGRLGFANSAQGWSFHVRVENLTDEQTANVAYEALPAGGMIFKAPSPPRLVFGGFRWEF